MPRAPLQPPDALHLDASVELQYMVADWPWSIVEEGEAVMLTTGAGAGVFTVTVTLSLALPPSPLQVSV